MNLSSENSVGSLTVETAWISIGPWPPPRSSGSCEKSKRVDTRRRSLDSPQVAAVDRTVVDGNAADGDLAVARAARDDFSLPATRP